jgi:hypothetical protein
MTERLEMTPLTQAVPAATSCQTTTPLLQRPNCLSPLQTTAPGVEHELPEAPPDGGAGAGAGAGAAPPEGAGFAGVGAAVTVTSVVEVRAGTAAMLDAPGAKTPPGLDGAAEGLGDG